MELDKLHVLHRTFGTVDHGDAVSRGYQRVGGMCGKQASQPPVAMMVTLERKVSTSPVVSFEHVGTVAFDARGMAGNDDSQVMLGNDFHSKVVGQIR